MKKLLVFIILFLAVGETTVLAQNWSSCGQGFFYQPTGLFSDTISDKLYAIGFATTVDGMQANNIASWDGTTWDTLGHGAIGASGNFLIRYKNKLYLQRNDNIYTWNFNTSVWDSVPGGYIGGSVYKAVIYNNDLILVGYFNKVGSMTAHNIVRFDGTSFYPVGFPTFSIYIRAVEIYNNEIYIGGNFNDTIYNGIAKWNGSQWINLDNGFVGGGPEIVNLKTYRNRLYAGGTYYGTKNGYCPSLATWDGIKWNNIGGIYYNSFPWGVVNTMFEFRNKLYVFGNFDRAGDIDVNNAAIWNDTSWCSMNTNFESPIALATIFQNKIYIGQHYKIDNDSVRLLGYYTGSNYFGVCGAAVGLMENQRSTSIKIYPNPTNSILYISDEGNELQNSTIEITNGLGQNVFKAPFSNSIDVSSLLPGYYFMSISLSNKKTLHSKFIKE